MNAVQQILPKAGKDVVVEIDLDRGHDNAAAHLDCDTGDVGIEGHWPPGSARFHDAAEAGGPAVQRKFLPRESLCVDAGLVEMGGVCGFGGAHAGLVANYRLE